jgi:hypothetical protein
VFVSTSSELLFISRHSSFGYLGDVLDMSSTPSWKHLLAQQDGAISCIGGFGSNEVCAYWNR